MRSRWGEGRATRPWQHAFAGVESPAGDAFRIAIVADTHSQPHVRLDEHLERYAPHAILHAGDIGHRDVLDRLARHATLHAVRGNIDARDHDLPDSLLLDLSAPAGRRLRVLLMHIAVNGPRLRADAHRLAKAHGAELVVCGHSHVPFIGADRQIAVFNPGSVGPRRFSLPIVFGTLTFNQSGGRLAHVDCETGAPWSPP